MRIFTKLFLTLVLGLCSLASANATKLYATYGTPASSGAWDAETSTYSWTQSSNNLMTIFECPNGMLAEYQSLHLTTSDYNSGPYRVCFMNGSTAVATIAFYSAGQKDLVFSERSETKDLDLSQITRISFGGASGNGSIKLVSKPYLQKPFKLEFDENGEAEISVTDLTASGCFSLDDETGVLTSVSTTEWGQLKVNLPAEGVDLSSVTNIKVEQSGDGDIINTLEITDAVNGSLNVWYGSKYNCNFTDYASKATAVTSIMWSAPWQATKDGSMTITSIKLKANTIVAEKMGEPVVLNTLPYYNYPDVTTTNPTWNMGVEADTYYGSYSSNPEHFVDLTGYSELRIYRDSNDGFRAFFFTATGTGYNTIDASSAATSWNESDKYFSVDLSQVEKFEEKVYLIGIKSASYGVKNIVNNIVVVKSAEAGRPQYTLTGSGVLSASAKAALADETALLIDATGVTGSDITLTTANPNCLIRANAGVLANKQNVIVDNVVASLVLTDGYPFVAVDGVSLTMATYERAASNKYATVCMPFMLHPMNNLKYYTLQAIEDDVLTIAEASAPFPSGTPYIVEVLSGEMQIVGAGPMNAAREVAQGDLTFIGTYEQKVVKAADYENPIYAISNNQFVKANNSITLNPFRAFFTAKSSEAKLRIAVADEATAIQQLTDEDAPVVGIYGLDGAERSSLQKGMNIIKKSNGQSLKVMVK